VITSERWAVIQDLRTTILRRFPRTNPAVAARPLPGSRGLQ